MRTLLAPGLIRSAKRNFNFDQRLVRLFEIGKVYGPDPCGVPRERNTIGILGTGGFAIKTGRILQPIMGFST